jgi:hypothetical protein
MTTDELKAVITQFNADHSGVYEARLYITDIIEKKRKAEIEEAKFKEKTKNNLTLEEIRAKYPRIKFTEGMPGMMSERIDATNQYFLLTVWLDDHSGHYSINYSALSQSSGVIKMPFVSMTERLTIESTLAWLDQLEKQMP